MDSDSLPDPREELRALTRAARAQATRARARGSRLKPSSATKVQPSPAPASVPAPAGTKAASKGLATPAKSAEDVRLQAAAARDLSELKACVARCEACSLAKTRTQTVFQDGSAQRKLMFIGEAPGADEDRTGVPFVGRAGQLLTDIITKGMGIPREEVLIANVLKCRPPDNREPTPLEKAICTPWLDRQIELQDPTVLIPLGRHASMHILQREATMGEMRSQIHTVGARQVIPTYHPAYLLRSPGEKKECWKDIQLAMGVLGIPIPPR